MLSTSQSRENVAVISPWVTRRGPSVPGVCSEKHSRWSTAPVSVTEARLAAYSGRSALAKVWKQPVSMIVRNGGRRQPALAGLPPSVLDRGLGNVDARDLETHRGREQGVLARAAAAVEHRLDQASHSGDSDDRRLGTPDVPRHGVLLVRVVPRPPGHA